MERDELFTITVASAAQRIRSGTLTPRELVQSLLDRIENTDPTIKAYLKVCNEDALEMATIAERQIQSGYDLGPLHGIPVSVKDLIETKGITTTAGSKLLSDYVPLEDATVVKRLKSAGAIILGKTNTHEFALGGVTPPTLNPWNTAHIPGGSSGGSAAATATGSALISLGSDTGGSIRIPASYCGVVGLKPTYGRVSKAGVFPEAWSLDHVGPIAKTVRDCAMLMNVISGRDMRDPTTSTMRVPDYTSLLNGEIDGVKIGIPENYFFDRVEEGVKRCVSSALKVFEGLGATIEYFNFPLIDEIMGAYTIIDSAEVAALHNRHFRENAEHYQPEVRAYIETGFFLTATQYIDAQRIRGQVLAKILDLFNHVNVIVTPAQPMVAPKVGATSVVIDGVAEDPLIAMVRFAAPFNLTGLPAVSIPCGFSSGLPAGLQIVGQLFDEISVLRIAEAYERVTEWTKKHPSI
ncbi:MAG TPA: amidase [Candidatus Bathyarchaeia archaeon]|nr:amidase [Candidatus Bathyarchaeia archaeon]